MPIVTAGDHPDLKAAAMTTLRDGWPAFVLRDQISNAHRADAEASFPEFQVLLVEDGEVLAAAGAVALRWNGAVATLPADGYDGALTTAVTEHQRGIAPDTLCIMAATVLPGRTGGGLAGKVLTGLRERAAEAGLTRVVVPVRPTLKSSYPLTPMTDYLRWTRDDGLHLDPWIRTHQRLGATILGPAPRSMVVTGTVADWTKWTDLAFPQSGRYVVLGEVLSSRRARPRT